jgi:hypothetical protein
MKKIILITATIIFVLCGFAGYKIINKKSKDISSLKPDISIDAKALIEEFNKSNSISQPRYLSKIIKVSGKIKSIDPAGALVLEGPEEESSIVCGFDPRHIRDLKKLNAGSTVTVQGRCTSFEKGEEMLGVNLGTTVQLAFAGVKKP